MGPRLFDRIRMLRETIAGEADELARRSEFREEGAEEEEEAEEEVR